MLKQVYFRIMIDFGNSGISVEINFNKIEQFTHLSRILVIFMLNMDVFNTFLLLWQ